MLFTILERDVFFFSKELVDMYTIKTSKILGLRPRYLVANAIIPKSLAALIRKIS